MPPEMQASEDFGVALIFLFLYFLVLYISICIAAWVAEYKKTENIALGKFIL